MKLLEDERLLGRLDPWPRIPDLDFDAIAARAHAENYLAARGVLYGVGQQVLQHAPQEPRIRMNKRAGWNDVQLQPLGARHRLEGESELRHDLAEDDRPVFRLQLTGIEPRDV